MNSVQAILFKRVSVAHRMMAHSTRMSAPQGVMSRALSSGLHSKVATFKKEIETHLPADGQRVVFATAWLATDNVFVALMREHFPEILAGMHLVAIDTMHLFPTTLDCAKLVEEKYGKQAMWKMPADITNKDEFTEEYGDAWEMDHADFDFISKVEPFQRALAEAEKDILITGRRMDQAEKRIELDMWEEDKRILNPLADFSWGDITAYCDEYDVPVNTGHNFAYRCAEPIKATERHLPDLPWTKVDLGKPFWRATEAEIKGEIEPAAVTYVFKSFGDTHTTVPVEPHQSERTGRFVLQGKTECGIHTRTTSSGAPHGGALTDLFVKDPVQAEALKAASVKTIELNERQACDVFCLLNGAFSPLTGFMTETDYNAVVEGMRLPEKQLFGLPVTFDVDSSEGLQEGDKVLLRWADEDVAVLEASSIWKPNKVVEAKECYGTSEIEHPSVYSLIAERGDNYLGGRLHGLTNPQFNYEAMTPQEVRSTLPEGKDVVAFQNGHTLEAGTHGLRFQEMLFNGNGSLSENGAHENGNNGTQNLNLPYSTREAGPREAIQHMIIRKNFGATHFIIDQNMSGTKSTITGADFYGPTDAQEMGEKYSQELNITVTQQA